MNNAQKKFLGIIADSWELIFDWHCPEFFKKQTSSDLNDKERNLWVQQMILLLALAAGSLIALACQLFAHMAVNHFAGSVIFALLVEFILESRSSFRGVKFISGLPERLSGKEPLNCILATHSAELELFSPLSNFTFLFLVVLRCLSLGMIFFYASYSVVALAMLAGALCEADLAATPQNDGSDKTSILPLAHYTFVWHYVWLFGGFIMLFFCFNFTVLTLLSYGISFVISHIACRIYLRGNHPMSADFISAVGYSMESIVLLLTLLCVSGR